ncbi:MAG: peptide chain release factor N(5)-glutamine methyltransferase [Acidobacteriota bacterium]|nr:peptide chain release factor N(5)-glutamine methyltransferase [Acidobacteriota bacterium]
MTLRESLEAGAARLGAGPHPDRARRDAETLLLHLLGKNRAWLLTHLDDPFGGCTAVQFAALINRRLAGEPIQYITGECEFYGLPFHVTPAVLIPRPETEHLVEATLKILSAPSMESAASGRHGWESTSPSKPTGAPSMESAPSGRHGWETTSPSKPTGAPSLAETWEGSILDIGTGSGAIAIALAHHLPRARVTAVDLSADALRIAEDNARRNSVTIRLLHGDLLAPVMGEQFDLIVSNPPYVASADRDTLSVEVRNHEPHLALFAGDNGLDVYRRLIPAAFATLVPGGFIVLEIGYGQSDAVQSLLTAAGFHRIQMTPDLQGIPRVLTAQRP